MVPRRVVLAAATIAIALFAVASLPAAAPAEPAKVTVAIGFADTPPPQLEATLQEIVADAPLAIVRRGALTVVETTPQGYERLLADPSLTVVRIVGADGQPAPARTDRNTAPHGLVDWHIRLQTIPARPTRRGAIDFAETADARYAAGATRGRRITDSLPPSPDAGPGMLVIRGLDSAGNEAVRRVINDPRLVRYEALGPGNQFSGRRDFIRTEVEFNALLPDDPRVVTLSIASSENGASGLRELVRVPAR